VTGAVRRSAGVLAVLAAVAAVASAGIVVLSRHAFGPHAAVLRVEPVRLVADAPPAGADTPASAGRGTQQAAVSDAWVAGTAAASGIPAPAVRAYGSATLRTASEDPACHLGWTTLAGIGWIESQHGTIGGRTLEADGRPDRPIAGVTLDGSGDVAAVPDGSGGFQRAMGPMQFIPSTWQSWASDGDGDGAADPQDVDDAAYSAARYLCAAGADLATGPGWTDAVLSYNHSDDYLRAVYDAATGYAARTS
jgi:membrane-bound lytic murein transglycosylase B